MARARHVFTAISAFVVCLGLTARASDETQFLMFTHWTGAVLSHHPGTGDDALAVVWKLSLDDQRYIADHLARFMDGFSPMPIPAGVAESNQDIGLAHDVVQTVTAKEFLERAAILHADAVMFDRRTPVAAVGRQPQPQARVTMSSPSAGVLVSPGPAQQRDAPFVTTVDGEITGVAAQNWNWPFARLVLDQLRPGEADAFLSTWYHATTAYLFRRGQLAEAAAHLAHAARRLPGDARIDFDRGCLAESLAMNVIQQVAGDGSSPSGTSRLAPRSRPAIPSPGASNAQALEFFLQAATIDSHFIEARVRAARLLELTDHFTEADDEIRQALADKPADAVTAFYAHLFGARAAAALGQDDAADAHVHAALDLFPSADSALLAASQVAFHRADASTAEYRLNELADRTAAPTDPWRDYMFGAGRALDPVLKQLWQAVPAHNGR